MPNAKKNTGGAVNKTLKLIAKVLYAPAMFLICLAIVVLAFKF